MSQQFSEVAVGVRGVARELLELLPISDFKLVRGDSLQERVAMLSREMKKKRAYRASSTSTLNHFLGGHAQHVAHGTQVAILCAILELHLECQARKQGECLRDIQSIQGIENVLANLDNEIEQEKIPKLHLASKLRSIIQDFTAVFLDADALGTPTTGYVRQAVNQIFEVRPGERGIRSRPVVPPQMSVLVSALVELHGVSEASKILDVPREFIVAIERGIQLATHRFLDHKRLYTAVAESSMLPGQPEIIEFLRDGWSSDSIRSRLRLISPNKAGEILKQNLEDHLFYMDQPWVNNSYVRSAFKNVKVDDVETIRPVYDWTAIYMAKEDMLSAMRGDFREERWRAIIESSQDDMPESERIHLQYSNVELGRRITEALFSDLDESQSHATEISIVEGGVGGANTTHQVLKHLAEQNMARNTPLEYVKYKGFDATRQYAIAANHILHGLQLSNTGSDARVDFARIGLPKYRLSLRVLKDVESGFVAHCTMESGVEGLTRDQHLCNHIDLFLTSFAFHHVPNNRMLASYLFERANVNGGHYTLAQARYEERMAFKDQMIWGAELRRGFETSRRVVRKMGEAFGMSPARTFFSKMAAFVRASELDDLIRYMKNKFRAEAQDPLDTQFKHLLANPQKELLENVHRLLRPGGLLAIADPDGFSKWNLRRVIEENDREITIANFLSCEELTQLLIDIGFDVVSKLIIKQGKAGQGSRPEYRIEHGQDTRKIIQRLDPDIKDPNLGYTVIAKKQGGGLIEGERHG